MTVLLVCDECKDQVKELDLRECKQLRNKSCLCLTCKVEKLGKSIISEIPTPRTTIIPSFMPGGFYGF